MNSLRYSIDYWSIMRIGIISDIHGNLEALVRVLSTINYLQCDLIYCLGDIVGYGPFPNECIDLVRERCAMVVRGNHDSGVTGDTPYEQFNQFGVAAIKWTRKHITRRNADYLKRLPFMRVHQNVTIAHASPDQPAEWTYVTTTAAAVKAFGAFATSVCFIGHTHIPVVIGEDGTVNNPRPDCRYLINVGSVGQPRDHDPKASFGVFETKTLDYQLMRVEYDVEATAKEILKQRLPDFLASRLFIGL